jgi:hypothetical protein
MLRTYSDPDPHRGEGYIECFTQLLVLFIMHCRPGRKFAARFQADFYIYMYYKTLEGMEIADTKKIQTPAAIHSFNHPSTPLETSRGRIINHYICMIDTYISSDDILSKTFFYYM